MRNIRNAVIGSKQFCRKQEVIPKWRSVEKNVAAVLQGLKGVSTVRDVSEQNLGYDLEVVLDSGEKQYIEVKSVSSLGDRHIQIFLFLAQILNLTDIHPACNDYKYFPLI